jgi:hypothetical protein
LKEIKNNKRDDKAVDLFLFFGITSIVCLGSIVCLKYNGLKENDSHKVVTSNNLIEIFFSNIIKGLEEF